MEDHAGGFCCGCLSSAQSLALISSPPAVDVGSALLLSDRQWQKVVLETIG